MSVVWTLLDTPIVLPVVIAAVAVAIAVRLIVARRYNDNGVYLISGIPTDFLGPQGFGACDPVMPAVEKHPTATGSLQNYSVTSL